MLKWGSACCDFFGAIAWTMSFDGRRTLVQMAGDYVGAHPDPRVEELVKLLDGWCPYAPEIRSRLRCGSGRVVSGLPTDRARTRAFHLTTYHARIVAACKRNRGGPFQRGVLDLRAALPFCRGVDRGPAASRTFPKLDNLVRGAKPVAV
jgi:hypothetical protein